MALEVRPKKIVVAAVAVGGVADYWMKDVFHVAADLMFAAGVRRHFDQ